MWASWAWLSLRRPSAISSLSWLEVLDRWCGCVGVGASDVPPLPEGCAMSAEGGRAIGGRMSGGGMQIQRGQVQCWLEVAKGWWAGGGSGARTSEHLEPG
jgi:hypothetical protein